MKKQLKLFKYLNEKYYYPNIITPKINKLSKFIRKDIPDETIVKFIIFRCSNQFEGSASLFYISVRAIIDEKSINFLISNLKYFIKYIGWNYVLNAFTYYFRAKSSNDDEVVLILTEIIVGKCIEEIREYNLFTYNYINKYKDNLSDIKKNIMVRLSSEGLRPTIVRINSLSKFTYINKTPLEPIFNGDTVKFSKTICVYDCSPDTLNLSNITSIRDCYYCLNYFLVASRTNKFFILDSQLPYVAKDEPINISDGKLNIKKLKPIKEKTIVILTTRKISARKIAEVEYIREIAKSNTIIVWQFNGFYNMYFKKLSENIISIKGYNHNSIQMLNSINSLTNQGVIEAINNIEL